MTPEKALAVMEGVRRDPVGWARTTFGFNAWEKQQQVIESVRDHRITAVRSCHAIGKSTLAALVVLWFLIAYPRCLVLTTATSNRQVKGILWREIHALLRRAARKGQPIGGHVTETRVKLDEDWWAWGFTAKDYDATQFQGYHAPAILVVIDEAAGVKREVFEGLDSAMTSGHARMLMIGNPTDVTGDFGLAFTRSDVSKFHVSAFDTPNFTSWNITIADIRDGKGMETGSWKDKVKGPLPFPQLITPTWVREKWLTWCGGREQGEVDPRWQARVLGRFPEGGDDTLIPLSWIELANERWNDLTDAMERPWPEAEVRVGVDVARFGDDSTERAFYVKGAGVREIKSAPKQDTMATAGTVIDDHRTIPFISARIDVVGLGAGVVDRLNEEQPPFEVVEMNGAQRAMDAERYANRRAEWFWQLREALDPNGDEPIALPPDDALTQELVNIKWRLTGKGQKLIESKDDIRARIGRSPDKADAVAMANARFTDDEPAATVSPSTTFRPNDLSGI